MSAWRVKVHQEFGRQSGAQTEFSAGELVALMIDDTRQDQNLTPAHRLEHRGSSFMGEIARHKVGTGITILCFGRTITASRL